MSSSSLLRHPAFISARLELQHQRQSPALAAVSRPRLTSDTRCQTRLCFQSDTRHGVSDKTPVSSVWPHQSSEEKKTIVLGTKLWLLLYWFMSFLMATYGCSLLHHGFPNRVQSCLHDDMQFSMVVILSFCGWRNLILDLGSELSLALSGVARYEETLIWLYVMET